VPIWPMNVAAWRNMSIKRFAVMTLGAAMAISLVGCDNVSSFSFSKDNSSLENSDDAITDDEVQLTVAWWGSQERHNDTIAALDLYAEKENIILDYEYNSWNNYFDTLSSEYVGNSMPDVFQMSITDIIPYAKNGVLLELRPYIADGTIDTTYVDDSIIGNITYNGHVCAYPSGITSVSVAYVDDYFAMAGLDAPQDGWTWSNYIECAKTIYEKTGIPSDIPFLVEARWLFDSWIHSYGYSFFSEDGHSLPWTKDEALIEDITAALTDIQTGIDEGYLISPEEGLNWVNANDNPITEGKIAMSFILSNQYATYSRSYGKALGITTLPTLDNGSSSSMYQSINLYWCISSSCEHPEEAAKVINYLVNDIDACEYIGTDRGVSVNAKIRDHLIENAQDDIYTLNSLEYIKYVQQTVNTVITADPVVSTELYSLLKADYTAMAFHEMTPSECITDFIKKANRLIGE